MQIGWWNEGRNHWSLSRTLSRYLHSQVHISKGCAQQHWSALSSSNWTKEYDYQLRPRPECSQVSNQLSHMYSFKTQYIDHSCFNARKRPDLLTFSCVVSVRNSSLDIYTVPIESQVMETN